MPSIRDLVAAISQREGVDAVIVQGRDGLVIDSHSRAGLDTESVAALIPAALMAADAFATAVGWGTVVTSVLELTGGIAIVAPLSPDAVLVVMARSEAAVGPLVFELRRNRQHIAALV